MPVLVPITAALMAAQAAQSPAPPDGAETIVVTGERVKRSLRETASSVVVVTQRQIEAAGADRVEQLLAAMPNVQLGNGSEGPAIRGLDTTGALQALPAFLGGNRPRTTIVVDGRATIYNEFVFGTQAAWDIDRVEVFRSPQTTTQGVNSIAGAIFVTSNDPSSRPEGRVRLIAGDYRTGELSAVASGALSRDIRVRIAGDFRQSRTTSRIIDEIAGADPNYDAFGVVRAKLLAAPSNLPGTRLLLSYAHTQSQAPQAVGVSAPFRARRDEINGYGVFRVRVDALTGSLRQDVGDRARVEVVVSAGDSEARRFAIPGFGETRNRGRDWSAEAVVNLANSAGTLRLLGGMSHNHVHLRQMINLSLLSGLIGQFGDWQDGTGVFGEGSWSITPRTTLTAGLRYQQDQQKRQGALAGPAFTVPIDFLGRFHAWLPKLSLSYDFSRTWRAGVLVQEAYNPGGTTIRVDTSRPDNFAAETLWDYELFARGSLAGDRVQLSANLFTYDMRNAQRAEPILLFTPTGRRVGFANLFNVPRARSSGFELSVDARASERLNMQVAMGLLETRIRRTDAESAAFQGHEFDRSPHFTGSAAIDWKPVDRLRLSAQLRHHSGYFVDNANTAALRIGVSTMIDARAEYRLRRVSLFIQARNLLDTFSMRDFGDASSGEAEDPRRVSAGVEARF